MMRADAFLTNCRLADGRLAQAAIARRYDVRLRATHGIADVVKREKPVAGPPSPAVVADLSRCDLVLVGSAD